MTYETKAYQVKAAVVDEAEGIVEAFVNTLDAVDFAGDIMPSGIFDRALAKKSKLPYLEGIDHKGIAGKVLETKQQGNQQWAKVQFNLKTQTGNDAFWHVAAGDVDEWSVKWETLDRHFETKNGARVRVLDEIDWVAFGPVIAGASKDTSTLSVKTKGAGTEVKYFSHVEGSYEDLIDDLSRLIAMSTAQPAGLDYYAPWVSVLATFPGYCIAELPQRAGQDSTYLRCEYTIGDDGEPVLGACTAVDLSFTPHGADSLEAASRFARWTKAQETKAGRRHSSADTEHMQQAHDHLVAANPGIECDPNQMPGRKQRGGNEDEELKDRLRLLNLTELSAEEARTWN